MSRGWQVVVFLLLPVQLAAQAVSETEGTVSLEGEVLDAQGNPLSGAEVWVQAGSYCQPSWLPGGVTGADGRFVIDGLAEDQPLGLTACLPGHVSARLGLKSPLERPVRLMPQPAVRISGRVRDPQGKPIADAEVSVTAQGFSFRNADPYSRHPCPERFSALSEEDGSFSLEVPSANWSLEARSQGYLSATLERLHRAPDQSLDGLEIVLTPGAILTGRVLDAEGRPAAGAQVSWSSGRQAVSDKDGLYEICGVAPGRQTVAVSDPAHETAVRDVQVSPGRSRADLLLGPKRRQIRGRVVDLDGAPIAGARFEDATGETLEDGSFSLWLPKTIAQEIRAKKEGYFPVEPFPRVAAGDGPVDGLEVRMRRGASITGRMLGLRPQELAQLRIQGSSQGRRGCDKTWYSGDARGDLDETQGRYRIDGLDGSSSEGVWVRAMLATRCVERHLVLEPGQEEAVLDLRFPPVFPVRGRVLSAEKEPLAGVWIGLGQGDSLPASEAWTRSDGSFVLEAERGTYDLQVSHEAYVPAQRQQVTVTEKPTESLEVRLLPRGRIRGRLQAITAWQTAEVTVHGPQPARIKTEAGTYLITGLVPGEWVVTAKYSPGGMITHRATQQRVVLRSEDEEIFQDLDFHIGPLALSVRLLNGGELTPRILVLSSEDGFSYHAFFKDYATFRFENLREGTYRLQIGEDRTEEIELSSDRELVIDLAETGR